VVARKSGNVAKAAVDVPHEIQDIQHLSANIYRSIQQLQSWLDQHSGKRIAAYGAGGRGVMTIAALNNYNNIAYIVDKNPKAPHIYAPKSHLPVFNIEELGENKVDLVIVFSFGYFAEIVEEVGTKYNYGKDQFISILDILK
jgi:D-arabinose 1-dehydrogenase-like Zn-dependent alcohol dehydrogenase